MEEGYLIKMNVKQEVLSGVLSWKLTWATYPEMFVGLYFYTAKFG